MTDAELIAAIEAKVGPTLVTFATRERADWWLHHVAAKVARGEIAGGIMVEARDTRTGYGYVCMWHDPVPAADVQRRQGEALWQLERSLDGTFPVAANGEIADYSDKLKAIVAEHKGNSTP